MNPSVEQCSGAALRASTACTDDPSRQRDDPLLAQAFRRALESVSPAAMGRNSRPGNVQLSGEDEASLVDDDAPVDPAARGAWLSVSLPAPYFSPLSAAATDGAAGVVLPMPAAAIVAALDHAHVPVLPQSGDAGRAEAAWQVTFPGHAGLLTALHLSGERTSAGWRAQVMAEGAQRQAAAAHLDTLRQRLRARGRPLDEVLLSEDE